MTTPPPIGSTVLVTWRAETYRVTVTAHRDGRIVTSDWRSWWWNTPGHDNGEVLGEGVDRLTVPPPMSELAPYIDTATLAVV